MLCVDPKQTSIVKQVFLSSPPGLEVDKISNLRNSRAHSGTFSPKFSSFRIISEMIFIFVNSDGGLWRKTSNHL